MQSFENDAPFQQHVCSGCLFKDVIYPIHVAARLGEPWRWLNVGVMI